MALFQVALVLIPPHKSAMLELRIERKTHEFCVASNGIISIQNLIHVRSTVLELKHVDRQTDMINPICVHFMHIVQRTRNKRHRLCNIKFELEFGSFSGHRCC
jgi:hypothetical protein